MGNLTFAEKMKAINQVKAKAAKVYGKDVIMTGKEAMENGVFDKVIIPTPSLELNRALFCGGFGGIVELFGAPASGKTSLAIETIAKQQQEDPNFIAVWLETENSLFDQILEQHGVDLSRLVFVPQEKVDNAENALDLVCAIVANGAPNLVVINSVAGLTPKVETEEDLSKQNIALTARIMSKFFRKVTGIAAKNKTTMIFVNQIRDNVGQMFGDTTTTTGGRALGFYAHQRIKMNSNKIQATDLISPEEGVKISCIVYKNRYAGMNNPNTKCIYYAKYDTGIDSIVAIPQLLEEKNIFQRGGAYWYYPDKNNIQKIAGVECKFNSKDSLITTLRNNKAFLDEILKMITADEVTSEEQQEIQSDNSAIKNTMAEAGELDNAEE